MPKKPDGIPPPYLPFKWEADRAGVAAIKALDRGEATPEQQRRALTTIIEGISMYYDLSYRSDPYDTAFAEGRRFVGAQIVKLTKLNINAIEKALRHE